MLKKIQVTAAPNVGTPALFFLVQNRHTRWAKVWLFAGCCRAKTPDGPGRGLLMVPAKSAVCGNDTGFPGTSEKEDDF